MAKPAAKPLDIIERNRAQAHAFALRTSQQHVHELLLKAHRELAARLSALSPEAKFSAERMTLVRKQIAEVMYAMNNNLGQLLRDQGKLVSTAATRNLVSYMNAAEKKFTGIARGLQLREAAMVDRAVRKTDATVLRRISGDPQHPGKPGILQRYGAETIGKFEDRLQMGFATGKDWADVRDDLVEDSEFLKGAPRYWAERIVRTEAMAAYNKGHLEAAKDADAQLGDCVKILVATFDSRTGWDSFQVHGQIRKLDEPFECSVGGSYMSPPNRPNDRETMVTHRMSWPLTPELEPKSDGEVEARYREQNKHGPGPGARPNMSTVDRSLFGKLPPKQVGAPAPTQEPEPEPAPAPVIVPPAETMLGRRPKKQLARDFAPMLSPMHPGHALEKEALEQMADLDWTPMKILKTDQLPKLGVEMDFEGELAKLFVKLETSTFNVSAKVLANSKRIQIDSNAVVLPVKHIELSALKKANQAVAAIAKGFSPSGEFVYVKHGGKYHLVRGDAENVIAGKLQGRPLQGKVLDLDYMNRKNVKGPTLKEFGEKLVGQFEEGGTRTKGGKLVSTYDSKNVRKAMADYIHEHYGIADCDTALSLENMRLITQSDVPKAAVAAHWPDGHLSLKAKTEENLATAGKELANGTFDVTFGKTKSHLIDSVSTLLHEQIHGTNLRMSAAYSDPISKGTEEAMTEIMSRKMTRDLSATPHGPIGFSQREALFGRVSESAGQLRLALPTRTGSYQVAIDGMAKAAWKAEKLLPKAARMDGVSLIEELEANILKTRTEPKFYTTPSSQLEHLASKYERWTPAQSKAFTDSFRKLCESMKSKYGW